MQFRHIRLARRQQSVHTMPSWCVPCFFVFRCCYAECNSSVFIYSLFSGKYQNLLGETGCFSCPAGRFSTGGQKECNLCEDRNAAPWSGASACLPYEFYLCSN